MRKSHIVVSVLTFLGLAAAIGMHVFASCLLAIGIVAAYGVSVRLLLSRRVGRHVGTTLASTTLALIMIAAGVGLIFEWALALQYPFLSSLSLWAAIFGGSASWALLAMWFEEHGHATNALRAIDG